MPALQVKDFPADLYDDLRACATDQDRSMSQQTVHILREYLQMYQQASGRVGWVVRAAGLDASDGSAFPARRTAEDERRGRIERRKRIFDEIENRSGSVIPEDFPSPAELVQQTREELDRKNVSDLGRCQ